MPLLRDRCSLLEANETGLYGKAHQRRSCLTQRHIVTFHQRSPRIALEGPGVNGDDDAREMGQPSGHCAFHYNLLDSIGGHSVSSTGNVRSESSRAHFVTQNGNEKGGCCGDGSPPTRTKLRYGLSEESGIYPEDR